MEKLLQWSIDAAQNPGHAGEPDPKLLSQLFGFDNPRSTMRDSLQEAVQATDLASRTNALLEFTDLVEDMNNANEIGNLWEPLLYLVNDSEAQIRTVAFSAIAAATQNNEKSQNDLVATKAGIPRIMEHINEADRDVAAKALFALSCAIGHCPGAYEQFAATDGWSILSYIVENETFGEKMDKKQQRIVSLVSALVSVQQFRPVFSELEKTQIVATLEKWYPFAGNYKERLEDLFILLKDQKYGEPRLLPMKASSS